MKVLLMIRLPTLPTISFRMKLRHKIAVFISLLALSAIAFVSAKGSTIAILQPTGSIAQQQYDLLIFASLLSLIVVIPVFGLLGFIVWRYRDKPTGSKATYTPDWGGNIVLELIWWGIPLVLIVVLAIVTWQSSHALDPYRPIASDKKPVRIQVVALQWKWLFLYPDEGVASLNYLRIPIDRPVTFELTSDAPMNSFWIPQLGGQVYAMSGMSTKLHLQASSVGTYNGMSANISGEGFADMRFVAEATTERNFNAWISYTQTSKKLLTQDTYKKLAQPGLSSKTTYKLQDKTLYTSVIDKYMKPPVPDATPLEAHNHHEMEH